MSGFITVIRKNGRNTNGRNTNGRTTNSRTANSSTTNSRTVRKTNRFEVLNEKSFPTPERDLSKTWKRASIGQWGKSSSLVVKNGAFVQKKRQYTKVQEEKDCRYCHENHDIRDKTGEISCPKLLKKFEYEGNQKKQVQKERKSHRELAQIERTNAWAEKLRQQFAAVEIHTPEEADSSDESSDEEQREEELLVQKRLNRIKEVEAELTEAKEDLEEEQKSNDRWADAGDIEDLELRIECLEEKLDRLKNK